jgi:hypothetical protein
MSTPFLIGEYPVGAAGLVSLMRFGCPLSFHLIHGKVLSGFVTGIDGFNGIPMTVTIDNETCIPWQQIDYVDTENRDD